MAKTIYRVLLESELRKAFAKLSPGKVLDAGGASSPYRELVPHMEYLCLDLNAGHKPDIVGDVHCLPLKNGSFDTVIATELLEHCRDPKKVVSEFRRVLKKGGAVVASCPFIYHYHGDDFSKDYWRFSSDGLKELFSGFSSAEIFPHGSFTTTALNLFFCKFPFLNRLSGIASKIRIGNLPSGHVILAIK
ncbi:Ubiquinone biosynthesis O-methyltransferase [uncultured archaeon]|nr:Ubiquinone biosynthesis O-methyltransferase [uncultured archaeon]